MGVTQMRKFEISIPRYVEGATLQEALTNYFNSIESIKREWTLSGDLARMPEIKVKPVK